MAETAAPDVELRRLPAGRLLVDLDRQAQLQLEMRGLTPYDEDYYPALAVLWVRVRGLAVANRDRTPEATGNLLSAWDLADRQAGDPWGDDWKMYWREAAYRYRLMSDYLTNAGPYGFDSGEVDSPKHYVTKREAEISRGGD